MNAKIRDNRNNILSLLKSDYDDLYNAQLEKLLTQLNKEVSRINKLLEFRYNIKGE